MTLSNPTGGAVLGTRATATVQIKDNDTGIQFKFRNYWTAENAGSVLIGVVRGDDGNFPVTVDCATADITATSGLDYGGVTNTLSFAAGETIKLLIIPILNDGLKEPNETFRLTLSNPTGGGVPAPGLATAKGKDRPIHLDSSLCSARVRCLGFGSPRDRRGSLSSNARAMDGGRHD